MDREYLNGLRGHLLHKCRGYWDGTTCMSKRRYQQALADIRTVRASLKAVAA